MVIFWPRFFLVIHRREIRRCKFSAAVARDGDARVFVLCFQRIFGSSILCFLGNEAREPWFRCCLYLLLLTEKRRSSRIKPKREQGNRVSFAIFRCTHTERLTLTKATTFSFITFRSNFYRDISRNDNKGCVKPFGFDAKNKYACHTTKCLESFLDKYKQECQGWEGNVIPLSKNLFLYPIIIINYRSTVLRIFRYTVRRTKRREGISMVMSDP